MSINKAPFTPQQVAMIIEGQTNGRTHPLTCCNVTMAVGVNGLVCYICGGVQTCVPGYVMEQETPLDVATARAKAAEEDYATYSMTVKHLAKESEKAR